MPLSLVDDPEHWRNRAEERLAEHAMLRARRQSQSSSMWEARAGPSKGSAWTLLVNRNHPLRELLVLAGLAAFGCGLAVVLGDFLFAAIFGAANVVVTIEAIRRSR